MTMLRWEHAQLRAALGKQGFWGAVAELDAPAEGDDAGRQSVSAATSQEELIGSEGIAKQTNQSALSSRCIACMWLPEQTAATQCCHISPSDRRSARTGTAFPSHVLPLWEP